MGKVQRVNEGDLTLFPTCSWDLETSNLAADFGFLLAAGVKPYGKPTKVFRIDDYEGYENDRSDDSKLVADVANEIAKYTIAIGYNTQRFDVPFLVARMLAADLDVRSLSNIRHLDLIWAVRYRMRLRGASLAIAREHLATADIKTPLTGRVWAQAASGSKKALDEIVKHNIQDCVVLEQVAKKIAHLVDIKFSLIR